MRYLVKVGTLKQKVDYLEEQLKNIDDKINELRKAILELKWEGEAASTFNDIYEEYINELLDIERKILSYIKFLTSYYDKYGSEYNLLRKRFSNLINLEAFYDQN